MKTSGHGASQLYSQDTSVVKIEDSFYLICGSDEIYILNKNNLYSRKLDADEVDEFPVRIIWNGEVSKISFQSQMLL